MLNKKISVTMIWILVTATVIIFTAISAGKNVVHAFKIRAQIKVLESDIEFYEQRIAADSVVLEQLRYDEYLEQYARENYGLQRENECVYIVK